VYSYHNTNLKEGRKGTEGNERQKRNDYNEDDYIRICGIGRTGESKRERQGQVDLLGKIYCKFIVKHTLPYLVHE